jgi:hypothetical protein
VSRSAGIFAPVAGLIASHRIAFNPSRTTRSTARFDYRSAIAVVVRIRVRAYLQLAGKIETDQLNIHPIMTRSVATMQLSELPRMRQI